MNYERVELLLTSFIKIKLLTVLLNVNREINLSYSSV